MEPLLNLPRDQFLAALAELQLDPERRDDLMRQYRRANSPFAPIYGLLERTAAEDAGEGMQRASMLPVARPEGMSVAEAVRSGEAQFAVPQGLLEAFGGVAQAVDAPAAAGQGLIPADDMIAEALNLGGVAQLGGAATTAPRGAFRSGAMRSADDVAETPAQQVARLLREGRADDVTDDLMAQADPQEMYQLYVSGETGMDLPMDEASRMARAQEMGFDTRLYHETSGDFPAFDVTRQGAGRGDSEMPTGVFTKPQGGSIGLGGDTETQMPLLARTGMNLQVPDRTGMRMEVGALDPDYTVALRRADDYDSVMSRAWDQRFEGDAGQSWLNQNPDEYFAEADRVLADWSTRNVELGQDARGILDNALRGAGYDSATVLRDEGFLGRQTPTTVIFDPTNIRSRFARFDPRLSHLANLNAANIDPLTGAAAMGASQQQDPLANLRAYLDAYGGLLGR